jgi:hypothetical protein
MSASIGTFFILHLSSVKSVAKSIGKAEFFAPEIFTSPFNFLPP